MTRKRHSPAQIVSKLREAETELAAGRSPESVATAMGVSEQTLQRWRKEYGGEADPLPTRVKRLEQENRRLQRVVADLELDKAALAEAARGNF